MHKVFCGFAAAALLTVGVASTAGAQAMIIDDGDGKDAWVVTPPPGGTYWTVWAEGSPSSFLVDQGGNLTVDFGAGDLDGAVVIEILGEVLQAQAS